MDKQEINKINIERMNSWSNKLTNHHATPIVLLGVCHDHNEGQIVILTTEPSVITNQVLLEFLKKAVKELEFTITQTQ